MHINLLNNRQQVKQQYNSRNNKNTNPTFKGGTAVLDYLVTNPIWGATVTDVTSMGGPRTVIDGIHRGLSAAAETGVREFSSTANDASVGAYGLLAGTMLAGMLKPMGIKDPQRIFASNESLDLHNEKWLANNENVSKFVDDYVENLEGFNPNSSKANSKGYVKIAEEHKEVIKEDLKKLADTSLGKKDRKVVFDRLKARFIEATGAETQMKLTHGTKTIEVDSRTMLDDFHRLTKAFQEKTASTSSNKLVSRVKQFGKSRALLGLGMAMAISASVQPINVYLTKKRTGSDGFAGMPDREKDTSKGFKLKKFASAATMAGVALATLQAKPSQILNKAMFKSAIPSMDQIKILFGITIISRQLSARDKYELSETNRKDILGYLNWLIIGNAINKGILMKMEDKKNPVVKMSEEIRAKKGLSGGISKFFNSNIASRREVLVDGLTKMGKSAIRPDGKAKTITEMMKELPKNSVARKNIKLLNIAQLINYGYTIAVLGIGLPRLNIALTNRAQAKRNLEKQQKIKENVMTQKNQEFVMNKSEMKTFTSFKSQQTM
ncbi:hypothetical protein IKJ53_04460 [bacterium]|nr:hypothetical protein [bacterium]